MKLTNVLLGLLLVTGIGLAQIGYDMFGNPVYGYDMYGNPLYQPMADFSQGQYIDPFMAPGQMGTGFSDPYMNQQYQQYLAMMINEYRYWTGDYQTPDMQVLGYLQNQMNAQAGTAFNTLPTGNTMGMDHATRMALMQQNFEMHNQSWQAYQESNDRSHQQFIEWLRQ